MTTRNDPVLEAALSLAPEERAKLADHLLACLHFDTDTDLDPTEAEYRIDALRRGDSKLLENQVSFRF